MCGPDRAVPARRSPDLFELGDHDVRFAAALRGDHERSWQLFAESAEVAVPERTHSIRNPLAARVAFSNGKPRQALRRLSAYMDDLLENDNLYLTGLACIEFVDMMAKCGRPDDGATVLGFLGSAVMLEQGLFDAILADARHAIAEQSARVGAGRVGAAQVEAAQSDGGAMSSRQVLGFMRETLDRLADDAQLEVA